MFPSVQQLLIVLAIGIVIFGAKRVTSLISDTGEAVASYKKSMKEVEDIEQG